MRTLLSQSKRTELIVTAPTAGTAVRLSAGSLTGIARTGTTQLCEATTTAAVHGLAVGTTVYISGAGEAEFNGTFTITKISAANKFKFIADGTTAAATGTLVFYADIWFRHAVLLGLKDWRTANTNNVYIGASSTALQQAYIIEPYVGGGVGEGYLPSRAPTDYMENLADYWLNPLTNGDGLLIRYI